MIKFFRQIRKSLLIQNKTSKYFKYAIGEIILVVIGILIALQINNWNENRKERYIENKILSEIKTSLEKDLGRTEMLLKHRAQRKANAVSNIAKSIATNQNVEDSIFIKDFYRAGITLSWSYDKGPFESLKSIGLDKIKNDSIRSIIVRFYEVGLPLTNSFIDYNKDINAERRNNLRDHLFNYKYHQKDTIWSIKREVNFDSIKSKVELKKLLQMEKNMAINYINRLEIVIEEIKYVISVLEKELN